MSLDIERQQWEKVALDLPIPMEIELSDEIISGVDCLWVKDKNVNAEKVIVYLHGGGLVAGSAITHRHFAANMAKATGYALLVVNYRLLPEHQYPAPLEDLLAVYNALLASDSHTSDNIVFGGDSSGGGLILSALVVLRESGKPLPHRGFTICGTFDMTLSGESMQAGKSAIPDMSYIELKKWQQKYLQFDLKSPMLSPAYAKLSHLPPLLILAAGLDPWLSDSETVALKIRAAGGQVTLRVWDSMEHVWMMDSSLSESAEAMLEITTFLLLGGSGPKQTLSMI